MPTETLSQPITQNLTATFNCNVLWILYAGGVLWVRNVGWNVLLNLWVLWEKKIPASFAIVLFLTDNTEEQNTQRPTETLSQPITQNITTKRGLTPSPSPNGEGSDHWGYPYMSSVCSAAISSYHQANRGNLTYYSPLQSERGWGWGLPSKEFPHILRPSLRGTDCGEISCGKEGRPPPFTRFTSSIKKFILTSYVEKSAPIGSLLVHR